MRLNEISPAARKCVRWMRAHSDISRTRQDIEKQSRTSVPAVTEALGYLSDNIELFDRGVQAKRVKLFPPEKRTRK